MIVFKLKTQNRDKIYFSKKDVENTIDKELVVVDFKRKAENLGYEVHYPYFLIDSTLLDNTAVFQLTLTQKYNNEYLPGFNFKR